MRAGRNDGSHKHEKCKSRKLCAGRCLEAELLKELRADLDAFADVAVLALAVMVSLGDHVDEREQHKCDHQ